MRHTYGAFRIIFLAKKIKVHSCMNLTSEESIFENVLVSFVPKLTFVPTVCFNVHILAASGFLRFTAGILCSSVLA